MRSLAIIPFRRCFTSVAACALALAGTGTAVSGEKTKPIGLIVHWNGVSAEARHFQVREVKRHSSVGQEFSATTTRGEKLSGHVSHRPLWVDYRQLPVVQLEETRAALKRFPITRPYLEKRLPRLEELAAEYRRLEEQAAKEAAERGMTLETAGNGTFKNAVPRNLRKDGKLVIQHAGGVFPDPVVFYSRKQLLEFARVNPALELDPLFQEVLGTFLPLVVADGEVFNGARVVRQSEDELILLCDAGLKRVDVRGLSEKSLSQLYRTEERLVALQVKFEVGKEQMDREQQQLLAGLAAQEARAATDSGGGFFRNVVTGGAAAGSASAIIEFLQGGSERDVIEAFGTGFVDGAVEEAVKEGVERAFDE
jgi:hypothetical protein